MKDAGSKTTAEAEALRVAIGKRSVVMVGLMGCGKSSVGRRLASAINVPFVDADDEIEKAAGKTISEIFTDYGEAHFRDREGLIIRRLLAGGPQVLATGGGAFMRRETRHLISQFGISVWLKAELPVLMHRVLRRDNRPLLKEGDPEAKMKALMAERYPIYSEANITVESRDTSHETVVREIVSKLNDYIVARA